MHICAPHAWSFCGSQKRTSNPWGIWSYRELWATLWVLGIKSRFSARVNALNCRASSPGHFWLQFFLCNHLCVLHICVCACICLPGHKFWGQEQLVGNGFLLLPWECQGTNSGYRLGSKCHLNDQEWLMLCVKCRCKMQIIHFAYCTAILHDSGFI